MDNTPGDKLGVWRNMRLADALVVTCFCLPNRSRRYWHICCFFSDCPKNINITTSCLVRHSLRCHADGFPEPNYLWIDNLRGGNATYGETIELTEAGPFNYTCIAYSNISCDANSQRPFCRNKSSLWYDGYQNDTYFPYSLFNATNTSYQYIYEEKCINSTSIYGIAFGELTFFAII